MDFVNNIQESHTNYNEPSVVLIYADWCPHCQVMEPEWNEATNEMEKSANVIKVESDQLPQYQDMLTTHNAHHNGFPTIYAFQPGKQPIYYGGERTKPGFISWVNSIFSSAKKKKTAAKKSGGYIKNQVQSSKTKTKKKKKGTKKSGGYIKDQVQTPSSKTNKKKKKKNKKKKKKDE
jgi:thioredoxin-like negative regulator of GroEL